MDLLTAGVLVIAISTILVGLSTFLLNPKHYQNVTFFLMSASLGIWVVANYMGGNSDISGITELFYLLDYAFGILLSFFLMLFCRVLYTRSINKARISNQRLAILGLIVFFFVVSVILSLVVSVDLIDGESVQTEEILFIPYALLTIGFLFSSILFLIKGFKKSKGLLRQQISMVLLGIVVLVSLGATPNLIFPLFLEQDSSLLTVLENITYLGILGLVVSSSYAIIRHRLFDPRTALVRLLGYVLSFTTLIVFLSLTMILLAAAVLDFEVQAFDIFVYMLTIAVTIISYPYLRKFFDILTTKIFYQNKVNKPEVINGLRSTYRTTNKIDPLMEDTVESIGDALNISHAHIVVYDSNKELHRVHYGNKDSFESNTFLKHPIDSKVDVYIADDISRNSKVKKFLNKEDISVLIRLNHNNKTVGYILLGPKTSGAIYYKDDIQFVESIAASFALALSNAKKFEQLEGFNVKLQKEVDRATKKLQNSNEKLRQHDIAKNEFMSMTSHQLKPQLTAVQNFTAMLEEDGGLSEEQLDLAQLSRKGAERSLSIITGILDLPQFDVMDLKLSKAKQDLVKLVRNEVKRFDSISKARNIKISIDTPKTLQANVDNTKLAEAFSNIVRNALYYSPDETEIFITLSSLKKHAILEVRDSGQGVPAAERKKLFTKFYRSNKAVKSQPGGTGIGLFFLKKVIEAHGGKAYYKPAKPKGSVFGFEIPLK